MQKVYVLDTSVLIHDPLSIYKFKDNVVAITMTTLLELDKLKSGYGIAAYNARQVIKMLDEIQQTNFFPVDGGKLIIIHNKVNDNLLNDLQIIKACQELKEDKPVILVSKDVNMRVMAREMGVRAEDYKSDIQNDLPKNVFEISGSKALIDDLYREKSVAVEYSKGFYILKNGSSSALAYSDGYNLKLVPAKFNNSITHLAPYDAYQSFLLYLLNNDNFKVVAVLGQAGSGKTYLTLGSALNHVYEKKVNKILLLKPTIPIGKDIGFLPGGVFQKLAPWLQSYMDNLEQFGDVEYYMNYIGLEAITYLRGRNLANRFIIVDEASNLTPYQAKVILSRVGKGSKIVFLGDINQIDNPYLTKNSNGLVYIINRLCDKKGFGWIELKKTYRSEVAKLAEEL